MLHHHPFLIQNHNFDRSGKIYIIIIIVVNYYIFLAYNYFKYKNNYKIKYLIEITTVLYLKGIEYQ